MAEDLRHQDDVGSGPGPRGPGGVPKDVAQFSRSCPQGQEVVAVEDVGGNELSPKRMEVTDPAHLVVPGPSRAAHDDLGLDLLGHREARDAQRARELETGDHVGRGGVGEGELRGVGDIAVVVHADQELLTVADAAFVAEVTISTA